MRMCSGGRSPVDQRLHGRNEILGDGAAETAIGQLDDILLRATFEAAAPQDFAIDPTLPNSLTMMARRFPSRSRADGERAWFFRRQESR